VILVVENEVSVRTLIRRILEKRGYKVYSAENGKEALAILEALDRRVDLVLADMAMWRPDSLGVPVTYMTGGDLKREDTLVKPFCSGDLLSYVEQALSTHRISPKPQSFDSDR